jgi:hypothetical protein
MSKAIDRVVHRSQVNRAMTAICGKRRPRTADEAIRVLVLNDVLSDIRDTWDWQRRRSMAQMKALGIDATAILKEHEPKEPESPKGVTDPADLKSVAKQINKRHGVKKSAAARKAVSDRMRKYWASKKKAS